MSIWKGIKLNSVNARGFLFFLLITGLFAALIKFSKTYEINRTLEVEITGLPLDRTVSAVNPKTIQVQAETSGFSILRNSFNGQELEIPFDELEAKGGGTYNVEVAEQQTAIKNAIARQISLIAVKPKSLKITIDSLASKRVEIIPRTQISYATGFNAASVVTVKPDSITVVGPSQLLEKINILQTKTVDASEATQDIQQTVQIDVDSLPGQLKFSQDEVVITQAIARFTEGTVNVPITVLNDPSDKLKILPKNVKVVYKIALENFDNIAASDFQVSCDFNKANASSDYLSLKIERQPKAARDVRLSTKQVKYIVVN